MKAITFENLETEILEGTNLEALVEKRKIESFSDLCDNTTNDNIVVIAGRPGMGKTTFLYNMLVDQVYKKNEKVLLLSTNDCNETKFGNLMKLLQYETERDTFYENIILNDTKIQSVYKAIEYITKSLKEHNLKAIYIDDVAVLSLLSELFKDNSDLDVWDDIELEYGDDYSLVSQGKNDIIMFYKFLKFISLKYRIPIIITEEVSRRVEMRSGDKQPRLDDLRSERIEKFADKILLLHRPNYYGILEDENGEITENMMNVIIAKNKNGDSNNKLVTLKHDSNLRYHYKKHQKY